MKNLILPSLIVIFLLSCKKKEEVPVPTPVDYRVQYVGSYDLEVRSFKHQEGTVSVWKTDTIKAVVYLYDSTKTYTGVQNTFSPFLNNLEKGYGLTINFASNKYTHCFLTSNGKIREEGGYHYHHIGYFKEDSLYFDITNLGSLGGGTDYYTKGVRID